MGLSQGWLEIFWWCAMASLTHRISALKSKVIRSDYIQSTMLSDYPANFGIMSTAAGTCNGAPPLSHGSAGGGPGEDANAAATAACTTSSKFG